MWSTNQNWFQTWLQQKLSEHKQKHFASPSKNAEEKKKDTKKKKTLQSSLRYKQAQ